MSTATPDSSTQRNDLDSKNQPCASEKPPPPSSSSSSSGEDGDGDYHEASEGAAPAPAAGVKAEEASPRERSEDASHLLVCRICFEGRDSEGEGLGKLIAPCRCRGTMKFVHTSCLKQWRLHSTRSSSAMACDQCGAAYKFRRSKFVGLASSPLLLFALSVPLFLLLIWSVGFAADVGLRWSNTPNDVAAAPPHVERPWWSLRGFLQDDSSNDAGYLMDDDYYYYGYSPYAEPRGYLRLIKTSWQHVRAGGVLGALADLAGTEDDEVHGRVEADMSQQEAERSAAQEASRLEAEKKGWWSSFVWEWKYGDAGLLQGEAPAPSQQPEAQAAAVTEHDQAKEPITPAEPSSEQAQAPTAPAKLQVDKKHEKARARHAEPRAGSPKRSKSETLLELIDAEEKPSWMQRIAMQFSLGISLVGIISFLNMAITLPFLHLGNFGLGRGFARMTGGTRRAARQAGNGGDGSAIATAVLLFLIFLGVMRALHVVFKAVRALARRALTRLEDVIVEWGAEDEVEEQERLRRERTARAQPRRNGWRRWVPARWIAA